MKWTSYTTIVTAFLLLAVFAACSRDEENAGGKSGSSLVDQVALEAVQGIQDPIEKAETAKKLYDERSARLHAYSED